MVWTAPQVVVDGGPLTAAFLNTFARDNMLETEAGKANIPSSYFVSDGLNLIVERQIQETILKTSTEESTASTSPTNLATVGPVVTCQTNTAALLLMTVQMSNDYTGASIPVANATFEITGATNFPATTSTATSMSIAFKDDAKAQFSGAFLVDFLNPGINTFTMKYWNTGGLGNSKFNNRSLAVMAF